MSSCRPTNASTLLSHLVDKVSSNELAKGFELDGERIPLVNPQRGIFKPRQMYYLLRSTLSFCWPLYGSSTGIHRPMGCQGARAFGGFGETSKAQMPYSKTMSRLAATHFALFNSALIRRPSAKR